VLTNDTDVDGDTLNAVLDSDVSHGSLTLNSDGSFSYTHDGSETTSDSFTYHANDGASDSTTVAVSITVNPQNDPPDAVADSMTVTSGGTVTVLGGGASSVLANDTDAEGDTLSAVLDSDVSNGTLTLNSDGSFSYTHDGGVSSSDSFSYHANDGSDDSATVTVSITVNSGVDVSGVWEIDTQVTSDSPTGCKGVGSTGRNVVTIIQSGTTLNARSYDGIAFTGTINTATGDFSVSGTNSGTMADLTQLSDDTAFVSWDDAVNASGTGTTGSAIFGSLTTVNNEAGSPVCTYTEDFSGTFVYRHSGTENYDGIYALEFFQEDLNGDGSTTVSRDGFPLQFELSGSSISIYLPSDGAEAVNDRYSFSNATFDPNTGFVSFELDEVERNDFTPTDGIIDESETRHFKATGIFMRDPAVTDGTDGSPLVVLSDRGYSRQYTGDVDSSGVPYDASNRQEYIYGKRLLTQGFTRTIVLEKGNQTDEAQILVGLDNPPVKRVDLNNSQLYIEVLNGAGTILCSAPYVYDGVDAGRYFEQINMPNPDFGSQAFRPAKYSTANCNTSISGVDQIVDGESLTVRVLDTGPNGIKETTSETVLGDDSLVTIPRLGTNTLAYNAEVVSNAERFTVTPKAFDITVNGARVSTTLGGANVPVFGYFDVGDAISVSWPAIAGTDLYQVRTQGTGIDDFVKRRYGTTDTGVVIPGGDIDYDTATLRLVAIDKTTTNGAFAMTFSRRLEIAAGAHGMFNIELGTALPVTHRTFQVNVDADEFGGTCQMTSTLWPVDCTAASVDFATDTVTLTMQDDGSGTYTGVPGASFDLDLHFTTAREAEVTSPDGIPGVPATTGSGVTAAKVANPEFFLRTHRLSHNGVERTHLNMVNPFPLLFTKGVLSRDDGVVFGDGSTTSKVLWDENKPQPFVDVATEFTTVPSDDGNAQSTKVMASSNTNSMGFGNVALAPGVYKLVLVDQTGSVSNKVFRFNYTAPGAADYIAPDDQSVNLDGTDCSVSTCNDPAAPISVSSTPDISWTINSAVPASSYWRVIFRPTDSTGAATGERFGQIRTPFMQDGDFGLAIAGGTATWTNPGDLDLPAGTYEVQIYVLDSNHGYTATVFGSTTGSGGVGGDQLYVTVP
jgi:VCBS repeat-containing protein